MDIGPARRIIEVDPVSEPVPQEVPDLEPSRPDPVTADPDG
jgi:hypothetical protein